MYYLIPRNEHIFKKTPDKLVTFHERQQGPMLWQPTHFAQIDFIIANDKLRNAVKDVYTDCRTELGTDHFPVIGELKIKLKRDPDKKTGDEPEAWS